MIRRAHRLLEAMRSPDDWTRKDGASEYAPGEFHLLRVPLVGPKMVEILKAMGEIEEIHPGVYRLINDDLGDLWVA